MSKVALLAALLGLAIATAGLVAGQAAAKEYTISSVEIDAVVRPNGDVRVRETRVLQFTGQFSFVYWDLSTQDSAGIDVKAAAGPDMGGGQTIPYELVPSTSDPRPLTFWTADTGDKVRVQLNFTVADTAAAFRIEYVVRGAARRWADTAELYWQFVGDEAQIPSDDVRVTVHLPDGVSREQVRAWAHGPLWGEVQITADASVVLAVSPLPAATFVETRILFPAGALPDAPPAGGPRAQAVLDEERRWADEANRARRSARIKVILWGALGVGVPLAAIVLVAVFYVRHGREPRPAFKAEYLRDLPQPDLPPALSGYIWRMGALQRDDMVATLLDLINRGVIGLERVTIHKDRLFGRDEQVTYRLSLHEERTGQLESFERKLVEFLFHDVVGGSSLMLSELKALAKEHRVEFASGYAGWQQAVKEEGEGRGYLVARASLMAWVGAAAALVGIGAAVAAAVFSGWLWFLLGAPVCLGLFFAARGIRRRSAEAAELHAQYVALKRYLKDFGRMQEKPPDAVVLWERFLVYAVVFGIADDVVKAMQVRLPDVVTDPAFGPSYLLWFAMPSAGHGGSSAFTELHRSFSEAVSLATSSSSSGAGGGGGFSGGGGGGGGGGGFGAG